MINSLSARISFTLILAIFIILSPVLASTSLLLEVGRGGDVIFIGHTTYQNLNLPQGIQIENGKIYGITENITSKQGDEWQLSFKLNDSSMNVIFPEGTSIIRLSNGEISTNKNQISVNSLNEIEAVYTLSNQQQSNNLIPLSILAIGLIICSFIIYYYKFKKSGKTNENKKTITKKEKIDIIKSVLNEREKLIIEFLRKNGKNKMFYIRKMTNIPKASFSRHINEMERKGIIKKSGEGRNKFVELK